MRIVHILSAPAAGGAEVYIKDLAIEQKKAGNTVSIIFLQSASDSNRSLEFEVLYLRELESNDISYDIIGKRARRNVIWGAYRLRKILRHLSPDIVHTHLYWGIVFIALQIKRNFAVVYTHHNIKLKCPNWLYSLWNFVVDEYIGICFACTRLLNSTPAKSVSTIYNAVNYNRLTLADLPIKRTSDKVTIFAVGGLIPQKDYNSLISAVSLIESSNFEVKIAGEGSEEKSLRAQTNELGLSDTITFLGNISHVKQELASSDVFVMTSQWEGLPIALLEATLTGLPVVVTNVGGCAEVVGEVGHGFVAEAGNVEQIAKFLSRLIEDGDLRNALSKNAKSFGQTYDIVSSCREHDFIYRKLMDDGVFNTLKSYK